MSSSVSSSGSSLKSGRAPASAGWRTDRFGRVEGLLRLSGRQVGSGVVSSVEFEASPESESSVASKSGRKDTPEVSLSVAEDGSATSLIVPLGKQRCARSRSRQVDKSTGMTNDREAHAEGGTGKGQVPVERREGLGGRVRNCWQLYGHGPHCPSDQWAWDGVCHFWRPHKTKRHVSARGAGPEVGRSRWKAGAGLGGRERRAMRPGTDMTEQERDGARYQGQARCAWLWGRKCVCGRAVPRRPLSAPFDARNGRLRTNVFCL
jgi:hypothetical protein